MYCPNCRIYTKRQRKNQANKLYRERAKAQKENETNVTEGPAHAEVEQQAESSEMGETQGLLDGGILSDLDDLFDEQPTGLVSGSNLTAVDAHAYGGDSSMSSFPNFTPAPNDLPPFRANAFDETFGLGNPAVTPVSNQAAANFTPPPFDPMLPQFPVHPSSPPLIPIDPALLELDAKYPDGFSRVGNVQEAKRFFGDKESTSESPDSNKSNR
ncbi:hypothetical protein MMC29_002229, partial [Sticta canariensis]|nr:hypothetical protein [Sticta canariensis]